MQNLDFNNADAASTINRWVSDNTAGQIKQIVESPIDSQTVMFLINAVYFNGKWQTPFDPKQTFPRPFTRGDGSRVQVPMMSGGGPLSTIQGPGFQAVRLPYGEGRMCMVLCLPDNAAGMSTFIQRINEKDWTAWMAGFQPNRVDLVMPKLKLQYEVSLNDALKAMDMGVAFDPGRANFEQMLSKTALAGGNVYLSRVKHKTMLELTEEGTVAAGVTSGEIGITSMPPTLVFDRPVVAAILDGETGTILFIGAVNDPA